MTLSLEQRIELHKRMAAGYREAYMAEAVRYSPRSGSRLGRLSSP